MSLQNSNSNNSACSGLATSLLQILIPTTFYSLLCQKTCFRNDSTCAAAISTFHDKCIGTSDYLGASRDNSLCQIKNSAISIRSGTYNLSGTLAEQSKYADMLS